MEIDKHKKQFGNQAENYTKYRKPYTEELFKLLFSLMPAESKKILDIACGTGKSTEPLVRNNLEVFGIDHDPLMIQEGQKQAVLKNLLSITPLLMLRISHLRLSHLMSLSSALRFIGS